MRLQNVFLLSILSATALACVGPTTPFGPPDLLANGKRAIDQASLETAELSFHPERKVYHNKTDFSVEVRSPTPLNETIRLAVFHNGHDVSASFLANSRVHRSNDRRQVIFLLKDVRLKAIDENRVRFEVHHNGQLLARERLQDPECSLFEPKQLSELGPFKAPDRYVAMISDVAESRGANPTFLAGIVAQESGFDPKAVSWAKAVGLTQVTPLAEEQILQEQKQAWPRHPEINSLSYLGIKSKIMTGEINESNEWRLNPKSSLEGGMAYVAYLKKYWEIESNKQLLQSLPGDYEQNLTRVILASYNSGAARVKKAIELKQDKWETHPGLKEALRYIKKVSSYCYHYSKKEVSSDSET